MIFTAKELRALLKHLILTEEDGQITWIGTREQRALVEKEINE